MFFSIQWQKKKYEGRELKRMALPDNKTYLLRKKTESETLNWNVNVQGEKLFR